MRLSFNVRPRYTSGSPASVNMDTAYKVVEQERRAHEHALSGAWGEQERLRALALGLRACAEGVEELRMCWRVSDLITGEMYDRPFPSRKRAKKPWFAYTAVRTPAGNNVVGFCQNQQPMHLIDPELGCMLIPELGLFDTFLDARNAAQQANERCGVDTLVAYGFVRERMAHRGFSPEGARL